MASMRGAAFVLVLVAACSRAPDDDPPAPWHPPADAAWGDLPKTDEAALALEAKAAVARPKLRAFDPARLSGLPADASHLVAGASAIAAAYDGWMKAAADQPAYVLFGTLHDSRAQLETVASIAFRMKTPWGFALEQLRAAGRWTGAPDAPSADDADLATLARPNAPLDPGAFARVSRRQMTYDHAAWKFGYLDAVTSLVYASRGAGVPLLGCDLPPELRTGLTPGGEAERGLRELNCARALRSDALALAAAHPPAGGLSEDDPAPPERFVALLGARHIEPDGLPRFLPKTARVAIARVLGGRPRDAGGEETDLAPHLVVTDVVLVRDVGPDMLLLPDDTWGGTVDRASDRGEPPPRAAAGLPPVNVQVTSAAPARFAITDSSIEVGAKPEWLSVRSGHQAYVLVSEERTFVGAVDVPETGWVEVAFAPHDRALRVVLHAP
jgi:hypothetical protein